MGIALDYASGTTPLDPEEVAALIPRHIFTQAQLNEWEFHNIIEAEQWAFNPRRRTRAELISVDFIKTLHKRMFDQTWKWAGIFRTTEKNIGVAPEQIGIRLKDLCEDVKAQIEYRTWTPDEIAARFHHRLVSVYPFPNGNGRHSRLMADLLLIRFGQERFTWGAGDLVAEGAVRVRYIDALRMADAKNYSVLFEFVRSGIPSTPRAST